MKKFAAATLLAGALLAGSAGAAIAHDAPPCNDANGDGVASGREYAQHHIRAGAHAGVIGREHKPGSHRGFSLCDPSSR